ncbi:MAG TPA: hypothetical protein VFS18_00735 [Actinomycetota bacterium]|nr:hypothetical protein [Actinomycetota bacterium]
MKFEFENGEFAGTAEWQAPGQVAVEMKDPDKQAWFEDYFRKEDSFMGGSVECGEMKMERRDESAEAFTRAARMLAAYSYQVRQGDARRNKAYRSGSSGS